MTATCLPKKSPSRPRQREPSPPRSRQKKRRRPNVKATSTGSQECGEQSGRRADTQGGGDRRVTVIAADLSLWISRCSSRKAQSGYAQRDCLLTEKPVGDAQMSENVNHVTARKMKRTGTTDTLMIVQLRILLCVLYRSWTLVGYTWLWPIITGCAGGAQRL